MAKIKNKKKLFLRIFWTLIAFPFVLLIILLSLISTDNLGFMPTFEDLENPKSNLATELISEDDQVLGRVYYQNRTYTDYDEISPNVIDALVATEDVRFYSHSGIDIRGLARVFFKTILMGEERSGGGSTITQQLAKNLFPRDTTTYNLGFTRNVSLVIAKLKEWVTAVKLEKSYTKQEILTMYLNQFDFLYHAVGIGSAAKIYFNTTPDSLTLDQAATLVGMVKNPSYYNPVRRPEVALYRRNIVLSQMLKYDYISEPVFDSVANVQMETDFQRISHNEGLAKYFREQIRLMMIAHKPERKNYFTYEQFKEDSILWATNPLYGWCDKNLKPDGTPYDLYRDGLRIYTTINSKMQQFAETAIADHLGDYLQPAFNKEKKGRSKAPFSNDLTKQEINHIMDITMRRTDRYRKLRREGKSKDSITRIFNTPVPMTIFSWSGDKDTVMSPMDSLRYYKFFLHAGFMSINPHNGHIMAYAGAPDFKYFKYDPVRVQKRQVGSTVKPFLYTLAMQEGYSPCYKVANVATTFEVNDTTWTPKNSGDSEYEGKMVTLKWGLANSVNWISAWVMKQFNPHAVIEIMHKMGIKSYLDPVPSLVLGTSDISLYEMVSAYGTFANKGVHVEPLMVTKIEDKHGNVISQFMPNKQEAINEQTAFLMLNLMQAVVNEGTGIRLRYLYHFDNEIAGKTGTTQNHSDGWFMGVTPDLVSGVWVGGEDRSIHFDEIGMGQGANMALPIWAKYMQKVYNDSTEVGIYKRPFDKPANFNVNLDCSDNQDSIRKPNSYEYLE
ncbi:MAG TPA: transglycosylase domain-containing protein [Bacteroidales bacterium]|nr:transglycosylase domain-containing protein [Bacteroidales bacterium]